MSGTSADAVDAALVRIPDALAGLELIEFQVYPLDGDLREQIHGAAQGEVRLRDLLQLDTELGERFATAALSVAKAGGVSLSDIEGIGSHGQTVAHYPDVGGTLQLGSPAVIHAQTGIPVIADFRRADLAVGGQGAPLTPFFHHARFAQPGEVRAVLNIGGFTNVTFLPGADAESVVAFDPGPGNALIDRTVRWASGGDERYDRDGKRCSRGGVDRPMVDELLADPYFAKSPPKSTGHEHFSAEFFERAREKMVGRGAGSDDVAATLAALTVESVVDAARRFSPALPERWFVYGGGVHNPVILDGLRHALEPARLETTDSQGIPGDALEAMAFAALGWCARRGIASNLPSATGASRRVVLGSATPPSLPAGLRG
jgi:anhydro-N-acetylmuramic acid kinase